MKAAFCLLFAAIFLLASPRAFAHAVLVSSSPQADASVSEGQLAVELKFNSRIDAARSRLYLAAPDGKVQTLNTSVETSPDELAAKTATLTKGSYLLRWQVLAADGHITRGQIPFKVR